MEIQTERANGTLIAKAEGRIDGVNARDFEEALKAAISTDDSTVVMDLEGLSYISSAGFGFSCDRQTRQRTRISSLLSLRSHPGSLRDQRLRQSLPVTLSCTGAASVGG